MGIVPGHCVDATALLRITMSQSLRGCNGKMRLWQKLQHRLEVDENSREETDWRTWNDGSKVRQSRVAAVS